MEYGISGKVVVGDKYGRKLGFPTANLGVKLKDFISGVYGGKAIINKKTYRAAIVINDVGRIEAHLLGYRGDAYGKTLTIIPVKILREYKKFDTEADLIAQIRKDVKRC
jgi:FAD synthase